MAEAEQLTTVPLPAFVQYVVVPSEKMYAGPDWLLAQADGEMQDAEHRYTALPAVAHMKDDVANNWLIPDIPLIETEPTAPVGVAHVTPLPIPAMDVWGHAGEKMFIVSEELMYTAVLPLTVESTRSMKYKLTPLTATPPMGSPPWNFVWMSVAFGMLGLSCATSPPLETKYPPVCEIEVIEPSNAETSVPAPPVALVEAP